MVKVAAVYSDLVGGTLNDNDSTRVLSLTDAVSQTGKPTFFEAALFATRSYTERMFLGAGRTFGFACAAPMSAFSGSESLDMATRWPRVYV